MTLHLFRNTDRKPGRDTGTVHAYITQIRDGLELPVAVDDRDERLFAALAAVGKPEPKHLNANLDGIMYYTLERPRPGRARRFAGAAANTARGLWLLANDTFRALRYYLGGP